jgi:hypothetical protein
VTVTLDGERWNAIAEGRAAPTPREIALVLEISDERDLWLRRGLHSWDEGFAAGGLAHADDYGRGFVAGIAAFKRQIHGDVDDFRLEMRRWHVCCRDCRRATPRRRCDRDGGCPRCEVRTRETFGLAHPDDYPGEPGLRAAG